MDNIADPNIVAVPVSLPHLKNDRVSISLSVINNAHYVIFLVLGAHKSAIMHKTFEENFACPASQVNPANGELIFLLDKEAARELSQSFIHAHEQDAFSLIQE
jgi:6-phosphogluconolactonase